MKRLLFVLAAGVAVTGCTCAQLPEALFPCEPDGTCDLPDYRCAADNLCRPIDSPTDGGGDGGVDAGCGPVETNPLNCGECGRVCSTGSCVAGYCVCGGDLDCPAGLVCKAGGICVPDAEPCAAVKCPPNQVCRAGVCAPVACGAGCEVGELCEADGGLCRAVSQCRLPESCADGGLCEGAPRPDGTRCNDSQPCTFDDRCASGSCAGTTYTCPASVPCQTSVACAGDGGCVGIPEPDGTPCDDGARCSFADHCAGGVCVGTAYTCPGSSTCEDGIQCEGDGGCRGTPTNEGGTCNDGVACTRADVCTSGVCAGTAYSCPAPTACQQAVACAGDGGCLVTDKNNGDSCDDGVACTSNDVCTSGVCAGSPGVSYRDLDGDGRGDSAVTATGCPAPTGYVGVGGDCDDTDADVYQSIATLVGDVDADGYSTGTAQTRCVGAAVTTAGRTYYRDAAGNPTWLTAAQALGTDCNDANAVVFQSVSAVTDVDNDGYSTGTAASQCVGGTSTVGGRTYYRASGGAYTWLTAAQSLGTDCDDANVNIFQTISNLLTDADQDGFTVGTAAPHCVGATTSVGGRSYYRSAAGLYPWLSAASSLGTDCNDTNASITGPLTWYLDGDADGVGGGTTQVACSSPGSGYVSAGGDCDDTNTNVFQTVASLYLDADQDGYTVGTAAPQCVGISTTVSGRTYYRDTAALFTRLGGISLGTDCDDSSAAVQGPTTWYLDSDGDGVGGATSVVQCTAPGNYVATTGDCNDSNPFIHQTVTVYDDTDQDGFTDSLITQAARCVGSTTVVNGRAYYRTSTGTYTWVVASLGTDCDDLDGGVFQAVTNVVADDDRDGYPPNNTQVDVCVGASSNWGGRVYYAASAAPNDYWMARNDCVLRNGSNCVAPFDCYDLNASAYPAQPAFFTIQRGDGSFDYDCANGATTLQTGQYCSATGTFELFSDSSCLTSLGTQTVCTATATISAPTACGANVAGTATYYNPGACTAAVLPSATRVGCH